jgi:hypothetical protein
MRLEAVEERGTFGVLQGEYGVASVVSTLDIYAETSRCHREPSLLYLVSVCQVKAILLSGLTGRYRRLCFDTVRSAGVRQAILLR